jgi:hypothetical protein
VGTHKYIFFALKEKEKRKAQREDLSLNGRTSASIGGYRPQREDIIPTMSTSASTGEHQPQRGDISLDGRDWAYMQLLLAYGHALAACIGHAGFPAACMSD